MYQCNRSTVGFKYCLAAALVVVLLGVPSVSEAQCACAYLATCQEYRTSPVIFIATVSGFVAGSPGRGRQAHLLVSRVLRGSAPATVDFGVDGECAQVFEQGGEYLVYATRYQGRLVTSICSRTKLLTEAKEDLNVIQCLNSRRREGSVHGYLIVDPGSSPFRIVIDGSGTHREQMIDGGPYEMNIVAPGPYRLTISRGTELIQRTEFRLGVRACKDAGYVEVR